MDPSQDPSAVAGWNDLHTLEGFLSASRKGIDFGDPPRGVSIGELGEITPVLVQIVMSTELSPCRVTQSC